MGGIGPQEYTVNVIKMKEGDKLTYTFDEVDDGEELVATVTYAVRWMPRNTHNCWELRKITLHHHLCNVEEFVLGDRNAISLYKVRQLILGSIAKQMQCHAV